MESNELRIGNYVWDDYSGVCVISEISQETVLMHNIAFNVNGKFDVSKISSIPVTEEPLLRFGFKKIVYDSEETGYGVEYHLDLNSRTKMIICDDFSFGIENTQLDTHWLSLDFDKFDGVHHLQNIWYALTKEELCYETKN